MQVTLSIAVLVVLKLFPFSLAFEECSKYTLLEEADRSMSYSIPLKLCDWTLQLGWYRFREAAGNMMPTSCVPMNKCGTHATGWLQGRHPSPWEGAIQATVCFDWTFECCMWSSKIRVRNCGLFYVYELGPTPLCNLRYCGNGAQEQQWKYGETVYFHGSTIYGPKDWKEVSGHCIENAQSPINIDSCMVSRNTFLNGFRFTPDNMFGSDNGGDESNPELQTLTTAMKQITKADTNIKVPMNLNLYNLVPMLRDLSKTSFYSYKGSLTTPPCHQSVNWIVLEHPILTSGEVMAAMRRLQNHEGRSMCDNFRTVQPLNSRTVSIYSGQLFG